LAPSSEVPGPNLGKTSGLEDAFLQAVLLRFWSLNAFLLFNLPLRQEITDQDEAIATFNAYFFRYRSFSVFSVRRAGIKAGNFGRARFPSETNLRIAVCH
jgi:hypothetical protein